MRYKSLSQFSSHRRRHQSKLSERHKVAGKLPGWGARQDLVGGPQGEGAWSWSYCTVVAVAAPSAPRAQALHRP